MAHLFDYKERNFNFVGKRKLWYIIALFFIVPGLIMMIFVGMNQGIDFTGGSIIEVAYTSTDSIELSEVRDIVSGATTQTPSINQSGDHTFQIKTEELEESVSSAMIDQLGTLGEMTLLRNNYIGPVIGAELMSNARWALLLACILILTYITIRFRFNYALTAIIALLHDALVIISLFTIFRLEVDSSFIAAILTTIGYSINNTIVIFDRIRENETYSSRKDRLTMINQSINQTLSRTINTVLAILLLLLCLLIFGGDTTKNFVLALTIGMFAGFFSSVFLVGSLLNDITSKLGSKFGGDSTKLSSGKKRTVTVKR